MRLMGLLKAVKGLGTVKLATVNLVIFELCAIMIY